MQFRLEPTRELFVSAADGVPLFVRLYLPTGVACRGTIIFLHGACEYGGRYCEFAEQAAAHGWRILLPDLRGHGRSGGVRVHVDRFVDYLRDLDLILRHENVDPRHTGLIGHSTGGLIAARFAESSANRVAALVLMSPLFKVALPIDPWRLFFGRLIARVFPHTRYRSGIDASATTRDTARLQVRRADPLIEQSVTARWFVECERAMRESFELAARVRLPLLVLQGGDDKIVSAEANARWEESAASSDKTWRFFPEHRHELLHELDRELIGDIVLNWLAARIAPAARE
jgi:lysophospholipase